MAIEFFSGNCGDPISPRISFSHDFCHSNAIPVEQQHLTRSNSSGLNNPSFDFDFCVRENFDQESSSADELFSDGRLLPSEIKKNKNFPQKQTDHQFLLPTQHNKSLHTEAVGGNASTTKVSNPERIKEEDDVQKQGHNHKSFWRFKRSKSYGTGYGRSLCPLPLLSRSFSTSSTSPSSSSVKKNTSVSKEGKNNSNNNNNQKLHASSSSSSSSLSYNSYLKPPMKKFQASYGNGGVPVILNVPSANLFGFGSIFSKSKDKTKRK